VAARPRSSGALPLVLGRLTTRTLRRAVTREVLCNDNRERLWEHSMVWSDRSLFHWRFTTYWRYRRGLPRLFAEPAHAHARIVHLQSPGAAEAWLAGVT
jgi:hypothetical protein